MSIIEFGTNAFLVASLGMGILTGLFFSFSKFYKSFLGWLVAAYMISTSGIMGMASFRILTDADSKGFYYVRLSMLILFALIIWSSVFAYGYIQFFAKDRNK